MESTAAVSALSALAHEARLKIFRLLVRADRGGVAAGEIARRTGAPPSSLSANLNVLSRAGLVRSRREGRSIIYTADYDRMRHLLGFLLEDCCGGASEICAPLVEVASRAACCVQPDQKGTA